MKGNAVKLGELLEVQNGFAFKKEFFSDVEGKPLIRIRDIDKGSTEAFYVGEYREEFLVHEGDYLIGMDGAFTCRKWTGPEALLNQRVCRLRNFSARVLPEYVFFGIQPALTAIEGTTSFVTVKHISGKQILDIELPLPDIQEQRRIVDILSRAEGIVRLQNEAQQKAADLVPAIYLEMFGDPAANPKGWSVVPLGEALAAADYGSSTKASDTRNGVPLIRMGNVGFDGNLNLSNLKYVQLDDAAVEKYVLRKGDILFNRTNSKDLVGKTGLWDGGLHAVVASYFIRLRVDEGMLVPTYLWALMNGRHMKKVLFQTARGAIGQANINSKELKAFRVALPPISLQRAFENQVESVQSICSQQANALTKADATFAALLSKAFPL